MTDDLTPPPPPPPSAVGTPYVAELSVAPVQKKGLGTRALAAGLGVVLLGGGLAFAVAQSAAGGASTPEEAVQQLFDAISDEDIIGVLDVLPDGERRSFQQPLEDLSSELQRLGVLSDGFDLSDVGGIDLKFSDLDLGSEVLAEGVSVVHLRGGNLTTAIIPEDLPIGDELRSLIEELNGEPLEIEPSSDTEALHSDGDSLDIVTIEEDGSWRVSLYYSIAEAARASTDLPLPDFGGGVTPNGQDSPEAAVEALLRAAVEDVDLEAMVALLPPDEMAALQDYAPLFLDDAAADIADFASDYTGTLNSVALSADRDGNEALVTIDDIDIALSYEDDDSSMTFDGECYRVEDEYSDEEQCLADLPIGASGLDGIDVPRRDDPPAIGIKAVEVDGRWYVSPTRTLLDAIVAGLGAFDDDALASFPDVMDSFFGGLFGGYGCESFSETGIAIGGGIQSADDSYDDSYDECMSYDESFGDVEEEFAPEEYPTSTTMTSDTTVTSDTAVREDSTATTSLSGGPTFEALVAMLTQDRGFTAAEANCIAVQVYAVGLTEDQLLELEGGPIPDEIADQINEIVAGCYSLEEGSGTG